MFFPPPPAPRNPGRSWAGLIFGSLATLIFTGSLLLNAIWLISAALSSDESPVHEHTILSGNSSEKIAVVPVNGIILGKSAEQFDTLLSHVDKESDIKALVVEVDTPGGDVSSSDEMYHRLAKFKSDHNIPVVISMKGLATSGGYYLSCAADYIYAEPTTLTANIGVLMPRYNLSELADKWGVHDTTLKSTGSPYKDAGSMLKPENPRDTQYMQSLIDQMYSQFKSVVSTGRGAQIKSKNKTVDALADGRALTSNEALSSGLIDQIGYPTDAYQYAAKTANLTNPTIIRYEERPSLSSLLTSQSSLSPRTASITLPPELLNFLTNPHPMYLWTGNQ